HVPDAQFDRSFEREVEGANDVLLANAVDATNPLLQLHRVPREVVIHDNVAELQVQTFAASIGRDEHLGLIGKTPLDVPALLQIQRPVEAHHGKASPLQKVGEHGLSWNEFGKDKDLESRIVLLALLPLHAVEQRLSLDVWATGFATARRREQQFDLLA